MAIEMVNVNLVAVVIGAIASMALGMLWYGPLFGKKWMELTGKKMSDADKNKGNMSMTYLVAFVGSLVAAYVLGAFIKYAGAAGAVEGAMVGIMAWLGFVATVSLGIVLWDQKPVSLYALVNGYNIVNYAIVGAILGAM
ncbi:MAG TPA: DUF1761 domain-containing protein [archaeon]|nr:DUF1761 domain-containing protein [archaeon]